MIITYPFVIVSGFKHSVGAVCGLPFSVAGHGLDDLLSRFGVCHFARGVCFRLGCIRFL